MLIVEFMVTEKCNLACTYCYMEDKTKFMELDKIDLFFDTIDEMMSLYNEKEYHISFFGGEPLLNWKIIEEATPRFNSDPRCHSIVMISNGLELTESRVKFMKDNNLGISLSFDGLWNDESRPLHGGIPSFNKYLQKKELIKSLTNGCKVMCSPQNFTTMTENYEFFVKEFGFLNPDFSLVRDDIYTEEDLKIFDFEIKRLADKVIEFSKAGIRTTNGLFFLYTLDLLVGKRFGKRKFGCFAGVHGGAFTPDGKFYPCARFASDEDYELYDANTKTINITNVKDLLNPKKTDPREFPECQACELNQYCNAGCTYSQLKAGDGTNARPVESVCSLLKMCYREAMRIMRELKDVDVYTNSITQKLSDLTSSNNSIG